VDKSLIEKSHRLRQLTRLAFISNLLFLIYFLVIHGSNIFYRSKLEAGRKTTSVALNFIFKQTKELIFPHKSPLDQWAVAHSLVQKSMTIRRFIDLLFSEDILMNILYLIALLIFFFFLFRDKNYRYNKSHFYLNLLMLCSNPINFIVVFNNHVENMGLLCYCIAFIVCSLEEYEVAVIFYFFGFDFFVEMSRFTFLPFFVLLLYSCLSRKSVGKSYPARLKSLARFVFDIMIFIGLNVLVRMELTTEIWEEHKQIIISNLLIHLKLLPVVAVITIPYLLVLRKKQEPKDSFYRNIFMAFLCCVVLIPQENWHRVALYFLLVLMNSSFMLFRTSTNRLMLYVAPLVLSMIWVEKDFSFLLISVATQAVNLALITFKNNSFKHSAKTLPIEKPSGIVQNIAIRLEIFGGMNTVLCSVLLIAYCFWLTIIRKIEWSIVPFAVYLAAYYPMRKLTKVKYARRMV